MIGALRTAACSLFALSFQGEAAPVPALQGASPAPAATSLQQAWLAEVVDLDTKRAITMYAEVARRTGSGNLERWVATARLIELQRLGIAGIGAIDLTDAPRDLRAPFAAAQAPLDLSDLARRTQVAPAQLLQSLGSVAGKLPLLRPIVDDAEKWLLNTIGSSQRDRSRQRREAFANRAPMTDLINAITILRAELAGNRPAADAARTLHFAGWKPPAVSTDHAVNLARFHGNLDEMLRERQGTRAQRELLLRLRSAVDKAAETDPAGATALLLRLPTYAERLLKETSTQGR